MPVVFSEVDKRALFFANNHLWKTVDGGTNWKQISPDLTRQTWDVPTEHRQVRERPGGAGRAARRHLHRRAVLPGHQPDLGRHRRRADPHDGRRRRHLEGRDAAGVGPWAKVSIIDAGRFDPLTAYAAINTLRLDDLRPHIFRTHDGGKTWTEIVDGIPNGETVNAVREDPKRKGLLFAGTERAVYVSFDDGANWQSLRLNMPVSSVRDIIVKDDDLVAATHGRGFWILDDITPLRQIDATSRGAGRDPLQADDGVAREVEHELDMPWPKEEPTAPNPPDGAIINYYLKSASSGPVTLEILQQDGRLVRRYSSADPVAADPRSAQRRPRRSTGYRPPQRLSTAAGHAPLPRGTCTTSRCGAEPGWRWLGAVPTQLPIQAIPYNTVPAPTTPWVNPGHLHREADGRWQELHAADRRQAGSAGEDAGARDAAGLRADQGDVLRRRRRADRGGAGSARSASRSRSCSRRHGASRRRSPRSSRRPQRSKGRLQPAGGGRGGRGGGRGELPVAGADRRAAAPATDTLWAVSASLGALMNAMQAADVAPTANTLAAVTAAQQNAARVMARWNALRTVDLPALNAKLKAAGIPVLTID